MDKVDLMSIQQTLRGDLSLIANRLIQIEERIAAIEDHQSAIEAHQKIIENWLAVLAKPG